MLTKNYSPIPSKIEGGQNFKNWACIKKASLYFRGRFGGSNTDRVISM